MTQQIADFDFYEELSFGSMITIGAETVVLISRAGTSPYYESTRQGNDEFNRALGTATSMRPTDYHDFLSPQLTPATASYVNR